MSLEYLLDTNVVSELFRPSPAPQVMERVLNADGRMAIASLVWHELLYGMMRLPESRRRDRIRVFLEEFVEPVFPVLGYDDTAAAWHALQRAVLERRGRTPLFVDGQIAAVAAVNGLTLVTRNVSDYQAFERLDVETWH